MKFHRSQLRADILNVAAADDDHLYIAIFDDPTDYENGLELEARLMADDGLLSEVSVGQFRITSAGFRTLEAIDRTDRGAKVTLTSEEKRAARDQLLKYIYEKGPDGPLWQVDPYAARGDLNMSSEQYDAAESLIVAQGLLGESYIGWIGINMEGQREAEKLGVRVAFQNPVTQSIPITNNYGVVQIAGANSTQTANQTISQSTLSQVLEQIEAELPSLQLSHEKRQEAKELVDGLKVGHGLGSAMMRAAAAALGSILGGAGSSLGSQLANAVGIVLSSIPGQ